MTARAKLLLDSLSDDERRELLTALLREHFAAGESEREIAEADGAIVGYLTSPGVRLAHLPNIDPRQAPLELAGPHYPAGYTRRKLEQIAAEEKKVTPANR